MSEFTQKGPSYEGILWEYKAGNVSVVAKAYAFGQYRLQIWCDRPEHPWAEFPDILCPEF